MKLTAPCNYAPVSSLLELQAAHGQVPSSHPARAEDNDPQLGALLGCLRLLPVPTSLLPLLHVTVVLSKCNKMQYALIQRAPAGPQACQGTAQPAGGPEQLLRHASAAWQLCWPALLHSTEAHMVQRAACVRAGSGAASLLALGD